MGHVNAVRNKAITCKVLPATIHKGTRIKAFEPDGGSVTISYNYGVELTDNFLLAAYELIKKLQWDISKLYGGHTKNGCVFVLR